MGRDIQQRPIAKGWLWKNALAAWFFGAVYAFYFSVPASNALSRMIMHPEPSYTLWERYLGRISNLFHQPFSETLVYLGGVILFTSPILIILLIVGRFFVKFILKDPIRLPFIGLGIVYAASFTFGMQQRVLPMIIALEGFFGGKAQWEILASPFFILLSPLILSSMVFVFLFRKTYHLDESDEG